MLEFVKSRYVLRGFVPTSRDGNKEGHLIQELATYRKRRQPIFGPAGFGAGNVLKNCFELVSSGGKDSGQLSDARILLLFRKNGGRQGSDEDNAFIQYIACTPRLDKTDETFGCRVFKGVLRTR